MFEDDEQLMIRVRHGDGNAFEILYNRYKAKIYSFLFRLLGDQMVAEELFQETFLRLYRSAPRYEPKAKFSTFLYRIASNLAINEKKRQRKVHFFSFWTSPARGEGVSPDQDSFPDDSVLPDEVLYGQQIRQHLEKALSSLPEKMKATVILSELEGKRYEEIADILDCSVGTVKSRVNRARSKIRAYFETHELM